MTGTDAGHVHAREAGHERVRTEGRRRLSHLFHLCARTGRAMGHVPSGSTPRHAILNQVI